MKFSDFGNLCLLGKLKPRTSREIATSRLGVGFECLDRDMWDPNQAWPVLNELGVKWARVQTGWAKTEKVAGVYDFDWLDRIVDPLIARGVKPWLSISYGNPLYTKAVNVAPVGAPPEMKECDSTGVGFPPLQSEEERCAWQRYVRALVRHYRSRVDHYEVWNEPDLNSFWKCQPCAGDYAELVRLTASPLREEQPGATVIAGAIAWGMTPWSLKFLEDCFKAGMHEWIDVVTYHGYKSIPERNADQEFGAFRRVLEKFKPALRYWQGEVGMQSYVPEKARGVGALSSMKCSETIQARMLLRRTLLELHKGADLVSYFHMADFAHYAAFKQTFHYGLVRLQDGSPKPAYHALQTLCSLLSDAMSPAGGRTAGHLSVVDDNEDSAIIKHGSLHANFVCGDVPVHAWWLAEPVADEPVLRKATMTYWIEDGLRLENPVLIDPVAQDVYAVSFEMDKHSCGAHWLAPDPRAEGVRSFKPLPISSDPLILTDRSLVALR